MTMRVTTRRTPAGLVVVDPTPRQRAALIEALEAAASDWHGTFQVSGAVVDLCLSAPAPADLDRWADDGGAS